MESWVEVVKEVLVEKLNVSRMKLLGSKETYEGCNLLIIDYGDDVYIVGLWKGLNALYAKIVVGSLLRGSWSCSTLEYNPIGYYAFATNPRILGEKIADKIALLDEVKDKLKIPLG